MRTSGILGLAFLGLVWIVSIGGQGLTTFIDVRALLLVSGTAAAIGITSFGLGEFARAVWSARALVLKLSPADLSPQAPALLRSMTRHLYASGAVSVIVGTVLILSRMERPDQIGDGLALALLGVLYALIASEMVVRPAARVVEEALAREEVPAPEETVHTVHAAEAAHAV